MKKISIPIRENQYLKDIMSKIPTNCILFKTLTGIGATHLEIITKRHSIIIEPNVPVIKGKKKSHKGKILGVYEGVHPTDIIAYLINDKIKYKKIMTTPESFQKVKEAINQSDLDLYNDFFLLFDECDRTSKDIDFRPKIILPLDDFFLFENKAFVSATATIPSDPRFKKQDFEIFELMPDFDYSKPLNLIHTNNPNAALRRLLNQLMENSNEDKIFIFLNSTNGIASLIETIKLSGDYAIFCSKSSKDKFRSQKYVHEDIDANKFKRVNFLTSRFYSAVDIYIEENPHVIIMTDLNIAEHTMIDLFSDLIQIPGRFRGKNLASFSFIYNQSSDICYREQTEAINYIQGCEDTYRTIESLRDVAKDEGAKDILTEALERVSFSQFIKQDGTFNHFMLDNYLQKERLKSFYHEGNSIDCLIRSRPLNSYFNVTTPQSQIFNIKSYYPTAKGVKNYNEMIKGIAEFLDDIYNNTEFDFAYDIKEQALLDLKYKSPEIVETYQKLGKDNLIKIGYSKKNLIDALALHDKEHSAKNNFEFLDQLNHTFQQGKFYTSEFIGTKFKILAEQYNYPYKNKKKYLQDFKRFFKLSNRTTRDNVKGYILQEKLFN